MRHSMIPRWSSSEPDADWLARQGNRFIVRPRSGEVHAPGHLSAAYGARQAARQAKQFNAFAATFLAVAEAEGVRIGKPK